MTVLYADYDEHVLEPVHLALCDACSAIVKHIVRNGRRWVSHESWARRPAAVIAYGSCQRCVPAARPANCVATCW